MNFHYWLAVSLARTADTPIGESLYWALKWVNERALSNRVVDIRGITDPYSPLLWDWLSEVEADWDIV